MTYTIIARVRYILLFPGTHMGQTLDEKKRGKKYRTRKEADHIQAPTSHER